MSGRKILLTHGSDQGFGGIERHVVELAESLTDRYQVAVMVDQRQFHHFSEKITCLPVEMTRSRSHPGLLWDAHKQIRTFQPDIVHAHGGKAAAIVKTIKLIKPSLKTIVTVHGYKKDTRCYNGHQAVIAVSKRVASMLSCPAEQITVITNGIQPQPTLQTGPNFPEKTHPFTFLTIGRLAPVKGYDILLDAFKGIDAKLWLVGDGPEEAKLKQQAAQLGIEDQVWFAGRRDDIGYLIENTDCCLLSSRREGCPYVLGEALLANKPVVSTDVGNCAEILPASWICETENPAALHELMKKAASQPDLLFANQQEVFQLAQQSYSLEHMTKQVEKLYQKVLS